jgi:hypothetical protein
MGTVRMDRGQSWLIATLIILNAAWILWIPSFPTLDGLTHLQTARMLYEGAPAGVYCENPGPVPNVLGHYLIGALHRFLPALLAERALLAMILLIVGLGTWSLARSLAPASPLILLVLPLTVNLMLALGFHNFLLGVGLAFLGAAGWFRLPKMGWPALAGLLLFTLLLFYTHSAALALFLLLLGVYELSILIGLKDRPGPCSGSRWRNLVPIALACIPSLVLVVRFAAGRPSTWGDQDPLGNVRDLVELRSLVLYHEVAEEKFTYSLKLLLVAGGLLALYGHWRHRGLRPTQADIPLVVALAMAAIHFFVPDSAGYASYIGVRTQWVMLLLFVVWVAVQPLPQVATVPVAIMALLAHQARNGHISTQMEPMAERSTMLLEIGRTLNEGGVVLPVNSDDNWLLTHASALLVAERDIVLLDNYECAPGYFPYVWCPDLPDGLAAHLRGKTDCLEWLPAYLMEQRSPRIDHIVLFGFEEQVDHCRWPHLHQVLDRHYRKGASNRYATVYDLVR